MAWMGEKGYVSSGSMNPLTINPFKNWLLFLLLPVTFISCRTVNPADLLVPQLNTYRLPALQGEVDGDNLLQTITYGTAITSDSELSNTSYNMALSGTIDTVKNVTISDERAFDIIKLFASEVKNINDNDSVKHGTIKLELWSFKEKRNGLMLFLSFWTLCIANLTSIPLTEVTTKLEIQVSIWDIHGTPVKRYKAAGEGRAFIALYWGYGRDAWRKATIIAFKEAMASVNSQIKYDYLYLKTKLI